LSFAHTARRGALKPGHVSEELFLTKAEREHHRRWNYVGRIAATAEVYAGGAVRLGFDPGPLENPDKPSGGERGVIKSQSAASRHRLAFAIRAANFDGMPVRWVAMSLLTWGPRADLSREGIMRACDRLRREWRDRWGEPIAAWVMEMTEAGLPHFHLFHAARTSFGGACMSAERHTVMRRGERTEIVRGSPDRWLTGAWLKATDQLGDAAALAFNRGGTTELLRDPDAAARYVEKEASKRAQKILPDRYADGLGRWWWVRPDFTPKPVAMQRISLDDYPHDRPLKHIWEPASLDACETLGAPLLGDDLAWHVAAKKEIARQKAAASRAARKERERAMRACLPPPPEPLPEPPPVIEQLQF